MENVVIKPLGKVLEEAGLISDSQINSALEIQSKYGQFKFGTILVTLGILKHKTIDFFVEQFPKLLEQPRIQPLGYYLEKAALINEQQIEVILKEQKQTGMLFGELAVKKGWIKAKTLDFFLEKLAKNKKQMELSSTSDQNTIKQDTIKTVNSKTQPPKAASHYSLLKEVFFWTEGHPLLTRHICQIISESDEFIPAGVEVIWVNNLVYEHIIDNWDNQSTGKFFLTIQDYLLNNTVCFPINLLRLYLQILQEQKITPSNSKEEIELINLGLVVCQENKLKVANRIYELIFNLEWVEKQLFALKKNSQIISQKAKKTPPKNRLASTAIQIKNEPFTQVAALIIVLGLLLTSPIVVFFNNLNHKLLQTKKESNSELSPASIAQLSKSPLCTSAIPASSDARQDWRIRLEEKQQILQEQFPDRCQNNLDKLLVLNALRLGKENRVLEGINYLCKISATSESFNQARFWLNRWYNSVDWGNQTQDYLQSIENCPIAKQL